MLLQIKGKMNQPIKPDLVHRVMDMSRIEGQDLVHNIDFLYGIVHMERHDKADPIEISGVFGRSRNDIKYQFHVGGHQLSQMYKFIADNQGINQYNKFVDVYIKPERKLH